MHVKTLHNRIPFCMLLKQCFLICVFSFLSIHSQAQNETNWWHFGVGGGIEFSSGSPVPAFGSPIVTYEGSAAISHPVTGSLRFYTDGITVYNAAHLVMPNGNGLFGCSSSTQSALIVPKPGDSSIFYIFTTDCIGGIMGCRYSIVDMNLAGGMGDVTMKNILLFDNASEQLSAVKHTNCTDWWIMGKELYNDVYHAYLLTASGVSGPYTSTIGLPVGSYCYGQGKFSPNGTKYAISNGGLNAASEFDGMSQLFDFNSTTGTLSNAITIVSPGNLEDTYGLSFSGDNSKLYVMRGAAASELYQYDLSSSVASTITGSEMYIGFCGGYRQLQIAKDFKIYITGLGGTSLSVINAPNLAGISCSLNINAVPIAGYSDLGLCNFPDSYFNQSEPCPGPEITDLTIPNIITPNGDGLNDVFRIADLPPASVLHVFNRWGNEIFVTDNYQNNWWTRVDGVYYFTLETTWGKTFSGFVHVTGN